MAIFNLYKTATLLWVLFIVLVLPMLPKSWNFTIIGFSRLWMLIKSRPFIYVILNFIVISILISSSSFTYKLNNFILKIHKKSSHNISSLISQTSQKFSLPFDDDTWWSRVVNNEETQSFTSLDESLGKEDKTVSFEHREMFREVKQEVYHDEENRVDHVVEGKVAELEEEVDTLDATWKAIMEAKNKGAGPLLKKSGTWTAGDRGGGGDVAKAGKGRLARYRVELKKWRTFGRESDQEKKDFSGGASDGGARGGGKEVGLTYHDELKNRADAFIARVTNDMRLQRLESRQRFLNTINRGLKRDLQTG